VAVFLVTGGAGFIGSHLAAALIGEGHTVRVVDDLSSGVVENLPAGVDFTHGDLTDPATATDAVRGCEVVLHQAAIASPSLSISEPRQSHDANINATFNVLMAARDAGVRRLVYAASASAYGDDPIQPKTEDMPANPLSPYALQKHVGESYCQMFTRYYNLPTVAIRYFNVFGPRQRPTSPYSGVLSLFIEAALSGTTATIYGDGGQTRDFTYIDDVVDGVLRAVAAPDAPGEVINVATGGRISINDAWARLGSILGPLPDPIYQPARAGDLRHSQADIGKAARLLGYAPRVAFEEGLLRTVQWARSADAATHST
jgi:nucleoside-diphosphate-sugar epimerase